MTQTEIASPSYITLTGAILVDRAAGRHYEGRNAATGQRGYWFAADLVALARREANGKRAADMPVRTAVAVRDL